MMKPGRPCRARNCPMITSDKSGYCTEHLKQSRAVTDAERGTSSERGYDHHWSKVRKMFLSQQPLCEECAKKNIIKSAEIVHHKDRNPHNNDFDNLEPVCADCHHVIHKDDVFKSKETTMLGKYETR